MIRMLLSKVSGGGRRIRRLFRILVLLRFRKSQLPNDELAVIRLTRLMALRDTFVLQILRLLRSLGYTPTFYVASVKELLYMATLSESVLCDYKPLVAAIIPS